MEEKKLETENLRDLTVTERLEQIFSDHADIIGKLNKVESDLHGKIIGQRPHVDSVGSDYVKGTCSIDDLILNIEDQLSVIFDYIHDIQTKADKL